MKKPQRIQSLIHLVGRDENEDIRQKLLISEYLSTHRSLRNYEKDFKDWLRDIAASRLRIEWWLHRVGGEQTPRHKVIAHLCLNGKYKFPEIQGIFHGFDGAPARLSPEEIEIIKKLEGQELNHPDQPENVHLECPPQYEASLRDYFGASFAPEMEAMYGKSRIDLRVNTVKASRADIKKILTDSKLYTQEMPYSDSGLRIVGRSKGAKPITSHEIYNNGTIEIQDEGSQLIVQICNVQPGQYVLDYCAGAGGKTLALAARMQNQGSVVASDLYPKRLERALPRFDRAGCRDMVAIKSLRDAQDTKWLLSQEEKFDVVLTDVPCSSTGTWRRNPELRWKLCGMNLSRIFQAQNEILETTAPLVKIGGRLVYSTCSLLPEENEQRVAEFLQRHPEYDVVPIDEKLGIGTPYMRLTPHRHKTDGFFAAVMERQP